MADKNYKKEKKTPKKSATASISTAAPKPVMPQPEVIKKKKKEK